MARRARDPVAALEEHLFRHGAGAGPQVVALSGGLDSAVLLHLLCHCSTRDELSLSAVTVDHGLRLFDEEIRLTGAHCQRLGVPHQVIALAAGLKERAGQFGTCLQEQARTERYEALNRVAGPGTIYLAHHANDQAETVLMNLLRGAGLSGLAGMRAVRRNRRRPLLGVTRDALADYAATHDIPFVEDPTNRSGDYLRNRVRHDVMPVLGALGQGALPPMARSAELLAEQAQLHDQLLEERLAGHLKPDTDPWVLVNWEGLDPILLRAFVHAMLTRALGRPAEQRHVRTALELLVSAEGSVSTTLLSGLVAHRRYGEFTIERGGVDAIPEPMDIEPWARQAWGRWRVESDLDSAPEHWLDVPPSEGWFPADSIGFVTLRAWQQGDRISPLGMTGSRLVSDLLGEAGVPRHDRERYPVLVHDDGTVLWVPGIRRSRLHGVSASEPAWCLVVVQS